MTLATYRKKEVFQKHPNLQEVGRKDLLRFVIQKHDANAPAL